MNNLADRLLVERISGAIHGGARLTEEGRQTVEMFRTIEGQFRLFLSELSAENDGSFAQEGFMPVFRLVLLKDIQEYLKWKKSIRC